MTIIKRVAMFLVVFTIFLSSMPLAQAAFINSPSLSGIQIFPKDHIWNTRVDNLPVDAKSNLYITDMVKDTGSSSTLHHYITNAIPYNVVGSTTPHQYLAKFGYNGAYADNVAYPIPTNPQYETACNDYHMVMVDVDEMVLYELGGVEKLPDGSWKAISGAVWDLNGYKFRKNNVTPMWSTDEAGLPVFSGLVRYDEVSAGHIDHSLRISVPVLQNTWVWPARTSSPLPNVYDPAHPPAGQRFRLKASYDISGYPPQAKVILQALKTYGATASTLNGIGNPVAVIGSPDTRWNIADLNTLGKVKITDFEAVDVSSLMIDPNSAQARQLSSGPSVASITVTTPNGGETWQRGTSQTVRWSYTGSPGSTVKVVLVKGSTEVGTISASTSIGSSGTGSYTWPIDPSGTTGSDYKISVQSISQPAVKDVSNNYFTLSAVGSTTTTPSITVTTPNGGETWKRGTSQTVRWSYTGSPGSTVKVVLVKGSTEVGTISASTSIGSGGTGSYTWPIDPSGTTGSDYKVSVQSISQPAVKDVSNNYFTLTL